MNYPVERHFKVRSNERLWYVAKWSPGEVDQAFAGWTAELKVRADKNDRDSTLLATWDAYVTLGEDPDGTPTDGYVILEVPVAVIEAYDWAGGIGWFDLLLIDPAGAPLNWIAGSVTIIEGMA